MFLGNVHHIVIASIILEGPYYVKEKGNALLR